MKTNSINTNKTKKCSSNSLLKTARQTWRHGDHPGRVTDAQAGLRALLHAAPIFQQAANASSKKISARTYGRASRIVIHVSYGRCPGPAVCEVALLDRTLKMLGSNDGREKLRAEICFGLQVGIAEKIATFMLEMITLHNWKPSQGRERLDELVEMDLGPKAANFLYLVEYRMARTAVDMFPLDLPQWPLNTAWGKHLTTLGQIAVLGGNLNLELEGLHENYENAAEILIGHWGFIEALASALPATDSGLDSDWKVAMKVLGKISAKAKRALL